jgi:hypothetical protein
MAFSQESRTEWSAVSHGVEKCNPSEEASGCGEVISITNWL